MEVALLEIIMSRCLLDKERPQRSLDSLAIRWEAGLFWQTPKLQVLLSWTSQISCEELIPAISKPLNLWFGVTAAQTDQDCGKHGSASLHDYVEDRLWSDTGLNYWAIKMSGQHLKVNVYTSTKPNLNRDRVTHWNQNKVWLA